MAGTTFFFVDGAQTDRAAKKLVRSHVMKGKNAGKRFHRRSRLQLALPRLHAGERTVILRQDLDKSQKEYHYNFARTMNRLYRLHRWLSMDEVKRMWLPIIFANQAAYYCNVALMQTCNEMYSDNGNSSPKALYHLSQTFNYVTRLLAGPDALSDSTIMIVVNLISQELIRKGYGDLQVHLNGLQKMIQLRGGLSKLEGNPALLLKVCKVDIMRSLQHGGPSLFFRNRFAKVRDTLALTKLDIVGDAAAKCPQHDMLEPYLHDILVDTMGVVLLFNNGVQLDLETLQEMILSLGYRIIQFHPSGEERRLWLLQASYHIGLTIFTLTVFLHAGRRQILDYERVDRRLKEILDTDLEDHYPELALWLSMLGGLWASDGYDGHWLPPRIRPMAMRLDIHSWEEVYTIIDHFPWVHALHDDSGRALWDQAHQDESIPSWIML
ncbi:uncharacterized protein TRIVIDRAFT_48760 [Trichoderma virens Gv29-8]|uniref:Uncharacterized protein n=1 Tax=Hypocrea virens (strain Gv29-8 / FGSC 10586) TaxID=413071 RepID=G9MZ70_HYPVG|nr:uncharacterized protein TRIVIDRAFT_48760 [Trichoderma virens Gv29-8]EHK20396.1 hypothetical protein TRIVIDRAFT_48760 [Trichoderma virens Gv29-8]UKZ47056.1 hypothetical protein TrVGV298_001268 [Trichoderma virens]